MQVMAKGWRFGGSGLRCAFLVGGQLSPLHNPRGLLRCEALKGGRRSRGCSTWLSSMLACCATALTYPLCVTLTVPLR